MKRKIYYERRKKKGEKGKRKRMKQEESRELSDNVCHIISNESIYIHRVS